VSVRLNWVNAPGMVRIAVAPVGSVSVTVFRPLSEVVSVRAAVPLTVKVPDMGFFDSGIV
jgi:hypothetical protein